MKVFMASRYEGQGRHLRGKNKEETLGEKPTVNEEYASKSMWEKTRDFGR